MLHLSTVEVFAETMYTSFQSLVVTIQDPCYEVRQAFLDKLRPLITTRRLPIRFNIIPFLSVYDPMVELTQTARSLVQLNLSRSTPEMRLARWEMPLMNLLHALAHHPDFEIGEESLQDTERYVR